MKKSELIRIKGEVFKDKRGSVTFANDFNFKNIKRFYQVENIDLNTIRAFHGHIKEAKYVYVVTGSILLCAVSLDNVKTPSKLNKVHKIIVSAKKPEVIYIPAGYANGFKALVKDTKVIFYSTSTLKQSLKDDYRFPHDYWGQEVWNNINE